MSFSVWNEKPPFEFAEDDREQIYEVGARWVVTDDPAKATQSEVDALEIVKPVADTKQSLLAQINGLMAKVEALP